MRKRLGKTLTLAALFGLAVGGAAFAADSVIYRQTFESNNGGFTFSSGGPWSWGTITIDTEEDVPSSAYSGTKCIGSGMTALAEEGGTATSGNIEIPTLGSGQFATVSYYAYTNIEMYDRGRFWISGDGGETWDRIANHYMMETVFAPGRYYPYDPNDPNETPYPNQWRKFSYDISKYSGQTIKLRYELESGAEMPGFYVDDVTVVVSTVGAVNKVTLTMEAAEDPDGSCPWVFPWDGSNYNQDNDIYSVARFPRGEYRDFYVLEKPLAAENGAYKLMIKEIDDEVSYTDFVALTAIDHAADVSVGVDNAGSVHAYKASALTPPAAAVNKAGENVAALVSSKNDAGYGAYSEDYVDVDFGVVAASAPKNLVLRVKGFVAGGEMKMPFIGPPAVVVKALVDGNWVEKGRLLPRFKYSEGVYDLSSVAPGEDGHMKVRIESISHGGKYHEIDFVGLYSGVEPAFDVHALGLASAFGTHGDALSKVQTADNDYFRMQTGEDYKLVFADAAKTGAVRDFLFTSEGYYVPSNTIYIYTWDGTNWVLRDGRSFINLEDEFADMTFDIDLSMHLPDPDGEYKVRLWNNFASDEGSAYVDYVGMKVKPPSQSTITGTLETAKDLRYEDDEVLSGIIKTRIESSDGTDALELSPEGAYYDLALLENDFSGEYEPYRDTWPYPRSNWIEIKFSDLPANAPPMIKSITLRGKKITWTTEDGDEGDSQQFFAAEIWTEPGGNGDIVWNPPTFDSSSGSLTLPTDLVPGETYYVRLRASDGKTWGNWTEYEFVAPDVSALKLHDEQINFGCFIDSLTR